MYVQGELTAVSKTVENALGVCFILGVVARAPVRLVARTKTEGSGCEDVMATVKLFVAHMVDVISKTTPPPPQAEAQQSSRKDSWLSKHDETRTGGLQTAEQSTVRYGTVTGQDKKTPENSSSMHLLAQLVD